MQDRLDTFIEALDEAINIRFLNFPEAFKYAKEYLKTQDELDIENDNQAFNDAHSDDAYGKG